MNSLWKPAENDLCGWFFTTNFPPLSAERCLLLTRRTWNFYPAQSRLLPSLRAPPYAEMSLFQLRSCLTFTGGECQRCRRRHAAPISSWAKATGKRGFCWTFGYLHLLVAAKVEENGLEDVSRMIWFDLNVKVCSHFYLILENVKSLECIWNIFSLL